MKQEVLKDKTGTIRFTPYIDNRPAIASSATVILKRPDGSTLQASTAATVNATTGEITYSTTASHNDTLDQNFIAEWTYIVSGTTYYYTTLYDVVLHKLSITVVDQDLMDEQSDIMELNESYAGVVDSSTASTLVDDDLKNYDNDYWNNGKVEIFNTATGAKQVRTVTDFVSSTGTLTVTPNWGTNPDSTYSFIVRRGFAVKIEKAFGEMLDDVRRNGFRPALILESTDLHTPHVKKALAMICKDAMKESDDKWHELYKIYSQEYADAMSKINFQYDMDEGGNIDGTGEQDKEQSTRLRR